MNAVTIFRLIEAAKVCGIDQSIIIQFISDDWITPFDRTHLFLDEEDIERIKLINKLQEMGVNNEAVPIILHLIDQLNHLHLEIKKTNR